jgi:hypothetical protein
MPRYFDNPCAECGDRVDWSHGARPRDIADPRHRKCGGGRNYTGRGNQPSKGRTRVPRDRYTCEVCGQGFPGKPCRANRYCSPECYRATIAPSTRNAKLRYRGLSATARDLGFVGDSWRREFTIWLLEFTGGSCHLCRKTIDPGLGIGTHLNRDGVTVDHVAPWSKSQDDSLWNLKPAHWVCNVTRSDNPIEVTV